MKKLIVATGAMILLSGCFAGDKVDPMEEIPLPKPTTDSGFYENSISEIGQKFLAQTQDIILFAYDSAELSDEAKQILTNQATFISENIISKIVIEGHSDERGTREYNLALGEKRATAVKKFLISQGVLPNYIQVISYGKERPLVDASSPTAWTKNRRGVTIVM